MPARRGGGVEHLAVKVHVLAESGLLLRLVQEPVGLLGAALQQQPAYAGQIGPQVGRQGRLFPQGLVEQLMGAGQLLGIGAAGGLHAERAVAGDEVVHGVLRGSYGADAVLGQYAPAPFCGNVGVGVFQPGKIYHGSDHLSESRMPAREGRTVRGGADAPCAQRA